MSKLKQRYLKEVKSFFPIMGKPERRHLKKLSEQINDYCLEKEVFSMKKHKEVIKKNKGDLKV